MSKTINPKTTTMTRQQLVPTWNPKTSKVDKFSIVTMILTLFLSSFSVTKPKARDASNPACLYPKHKPPKEKEPMKLSTGNTFISSKIDNWMSYKEFLAFSKNVTKHVNSYRGFYDERKMWPGKEYRARVPEQTRRKASDTMFQERPKIRTQYANKSTIYSHMVQ